MSFLLRGEPDKTQKKRGCYCRWAYGHLIQAFRGIDTKIHTSPSVLPGLLCRCAFQWCVWQYSVMTPVQCCYKYNVWWSTTRVTLRAWAPVLPLERSFSRADPGEQSSALRNPTVLVCDHGKPTGTKVLAPNLFVFYLKTMTLQKPPPLFLLRF